MVAIPPIPPEVLAGATKLAKKGFVTIIGPAVMNKAKKFWETDHGSKVKEGYCNECPIELFGDKACIIKDEELGEIVLLTSENIRSFHFVKDKERWGHTYYYYEIYFHDGTKSYVRMRKKYRDAMLNYT